MIDRTQVAILGSGNIGTDLMIKILRLSKTLQLKALVGVDPESDGLKRATRLGVETTAAGVDGLLTMTGFNDIAIVFDATSAAAHARHNTVLRAHGKRLVDLTPAALGPYVIPCVNGQVHLNEMNLNMVTCGGQATIPIVAAVHRVGRVSYAEIVASIASRSAGPGTRDNIDEFTATTARAIESVGGAQRGKAIIVLNPAEPPLIMRDTVYCITESTDRPALEGSIARMVSQVQSYVRGYRLKQAVQFESLHGTNSIRLPGVERPLTGTKVTVFLEVEGAAHYLPAYAGNLDIMTSAALQTAEALALHLRSKAAT